MFILGLEHDFRGGRLLDFFRNLSISPTVVFGVDGRVSSDSLTRYTASRYRMNLIMGRQLSPAEVAVVLGHRMIYDKFLETDSEWAMVLEDDSFPTENFDLTSVDLVSVSSPLIVDLSGIEGLISNYDVFPTLILRPENLSSSEHDFIVYYTLGNTFGTWAYLINRKAAALAVQNLDLIDSTADWPYSWRSRVQFARPEKSQFSVRLEGSLVEEARTTEIEIAENGRPRRNQSTIFNRLKTLFGLVGVSSLIASARGARFHQHYIEKVMIPFILRRIHSND